LIERPFKTTFCIIRQLEGASAKIKYGRVLDDITHGSAVKEIENVAVAWLFLLYDHHGHSCILFLDQIRPTSWVVHQLPTLVAVSITAVL